MPKAGAPPGMSERLEEAKRKLKYSSNIQEILQESDYLLALAEAGEKLADALTAFWEGDPTFTGMQARADALHAALATYRAAAEGR